MPSPAGPVIFQNSVGSERVAADQRRLQTLVMRLADDQPGLGLIAAEIDRVDIGLLHLADQGGEVFVALIDRFVHDLLEAELVCRLLGLVGKTFAVGGLVVNDRDLLALVMIGEILAGDRALRVVAAADAEDVVPPLFRGIVGQGRIGRGRRYLQHPGLVIDRRGRDR